MATIKYLLQSKSVNAPIYCRLSLGRDRISKKPISYKVRIGVSVNSNDWSKNGMPKQGKAELKRLSQKLRSLETYLYNELSNVHDLSVTVNSQWLRLQIDKFFNRIDDNEISTLVEYGRKFIEDMPNKVSDKGELVTISTLKKYKTVVNKLEQFDVYKNRKVLLKDIDLHFRKEFIEYLGAVDKLSHNTIGRYLKFVKTIVIDAGKNGYKIDTTAMSHFKGFTVKSPKVVLSFNDLERIKRTQFKSENHDLARDWLIIGCYTGQRVSDLFRMTINNIENVRDFRFIILEQVKTGKQVQIPIHHEVESILEKYKGSFPPVFVSNVESNKTLFNRYLKEICEKAGLNQKVKGNLFDGETERTLLGEYEKYKLVSSHICRRSFATNFYANPNYPTPLLMNITGHSTERMFLEYIGKEPIDYGLQLAKIWANEALKKKKEPQLDLIKNASNQ